MPGTVEKGDIVIVYDYDHPDRDNGIIGRVVLYEPITWAVTLEWPNRLSPYGLVNPLKIFPAVMGANMYVLSVGQLFETMFVLWDAKTAATIKEAQRSVEIAIRGSSLR